MYVILRKTRQHLTTLHISPLIASSHAARAQMPNQRDRKHIRIAPNEWGGKVGVGGGNRDLANVKPVFPFLVHLFLILQASKSYSRNARCGVNTAQNTRIMDRLVFVFVLARVCLGARQHAVSVGLFTFFDNKRDPRLTRTQTPDDSERSARHQAVKLHVSKSEYREQTYHLRAARFTSLIRA